MKKLFDILEAGAVPICALAAAAVWAYCTFKVMYP